MGSYRGHCMRVAIVLTAGLLRSQPAPGDEIGRAMSLATQGRFAEAEKVLRAIETTYPNTFEVRYRLGLILLRLGNAKEAAIRFEAAAQKSPDSAPAWLGLAQARLRLDQRTAAIQSAERAAQLAAAQPPLWRALAMFYADANEFSHAAGFEERWSRSPGADPDSVLRLCRLRVRAADNKQAVPACLRAIAARDTAELQQLLGDAYRLAGDAPQAAAAYQQAIRLDASAAVSYLKLVALLLDHRTPLPAIAVLDSAVTRFNNHGEFRRLLGLAYYQTGDFDKAIQQFLAVLDIEPDADAGYASLETLLPMAGERLPEIVQRLRGFRERRPESPVGHFLLSRALSVNATPPGAEVEGLLRQAIQADPNFWPAHFELAQIEENRDNRENAIRSLERVVKLNPEYAPVHYTLAQLYAQKGDRPRAVEHRRKHHTLLNRERTRTERARAESPALLFTIEPPPAR
jgi:tetratricopeptide (TPR) repeat protein